MKDLEKTLRRIDGRGYKAYKDLKGATWSYKNLKFRVVRVQGDPFAPPSVVEVQAPFESGDLPLEDLFHRVLASKLKKRSRKRGEGKSGLLALPRPSNAILRRSSVKWSNGVLRARVWAGLPSYRRRIDSDQAIEMLMRDLPKAVEEALSSLNSLEEHRRVYQTYVEVREKLKEMKMIAFVANGSILPRACYDCEEPLKGAIPFESPPSLKVEIETSFGVVEGMGLKEGIASITGPAFHGKTTLLEALAKGVWPHVPGDGRELVVTREDAFYVRSEDGRRTSCVDISTFLLLKNSKCFSTEDASGATSAASSFQEAVEGGSKLILLDEDYTATNFLFFDDRLEEIYDIKTVRTISEKLASMKEKGLSLVVVASGSAPILAQSDTVVYMKEYLPNDVTDKVRNIKVKIVRDEYEFPRKRYLVYEPPHKVKVRGPWIEGKDWKSPVRLEANVHLEEEGQKNFLAKLLSKPFKGRVEEVEVPDPWEECSGPECSEVRALDYLFALNRAEGLRASGT